MNIGIVGTGAIGATLARKLVAAGHNVKIANSRGPESIRELADSIGAHAVAAAEAVNNVDAIILSIPFGRVPDVAGLLTKVPPSVVVIDTSNYYPFRDGAIAEIDAGKVESIWVSKQLGRPTVKAWNAVLAGTLAEKGQPRGAPHRVAIPVAGDDPAEKQVAMELVEDTGFDAWDAGSLADSWRQQPGTPAYCTELTLAELKIAWPEADKEKAPLNRDEVIRGFIEGTGAKTHDETVANNRAVAWKGFAESAQQG